MEKTKPKILLQASIPSGGIDISDGYRQRVFSMTESLKGLGLNVSVLWLYRLQDIYKIRSSRLRSKDNATYFRPILPFFLYPKISNFSRVLASFWVRLLDSKYKFDCIQAETALHGSICSILKKKKIVVDFHGDIVSEMRLRGDNQWKIDIAIHDEEKALKSSSAILAASNALIELLRLRHDLPILIAGTAPCGVDSDRFSNALNNRKITRNELKINNKIVFCYLGGLQKWQNIEETVTLFKKIYNIEKKSYLLILTNSDSKGLKRQLNALGISNESYNIMALSSDQVPKYLPAADFGFLLRSESPVNRVASPTKFGEYLCSGLSVITTPFAGDAAKISEHSGCGYLFKEDNNENFDLLISFLQKQMKNRSKVFEECRNAAIKYQSLNVTEVALRQVYTKIGLIRSN